MTVDQCGHCIYDSNGHQVEEADGFNHSTSFIYIYDIYKIYDVPLNEMSLYISTLYQKGGKQM